MDFLKTAIFCENYTGGRHRPLLFHWCSTGKFWALPSTRRAHCIIAGFWVSVSTENTIQSKESALQFGTFSKTTVYVLSISNTWQINNILYTYTCIMYISYIQPWHHGKTRCYQSMARYLLHIPSSQARYWRGTCFGKQRNDALEVAQISRNHWWTKSSMH